MSKNKNILEVIKLLDTSANCGVIYDIMNSDWSEASKCYYNRNAIDSTKLIESTKLYIHPILREFSVFSCDCLKEDREYLFKVNGNILNIHTRFRPVINNVKDICITLKLKDFTIDLGNLVDYITNKKELIKWIRVQYYEVRSQYTQDDIYTKYLSIVADESFTDEAVFRSVYASESDYVDKTLKLISNIISLTLIQVFHTTSMCSYLENYNKDSLTSSTDGDCNTVYKVSEDAQVVFEKFMLQFSSKISTLPLLNSDDSRRSIKVIGDFKHVMSDYGVPSISRFISYVKDNTFYTELDLDEVDRESRKGCLYADVNGCILRDNKDISEDIRYKIVPTGITNTYDEEVVALFTRSGDQYYCDYFNSIVNVISYLKESIEDYRQDEDIEKLVTSKDFKIYSFDVEEHLSNFIKRESVVSKSKYLTRMIRDLNENINPMNEDELYFFVRERLIRLKRIFAKSYFNNETGFIMNTGLLSKRMNFMYIKVKDIDKPLEDISVEYSKAGFGYSREPFVLYSSVESLVFNNRNEITYSERGLVHSVYDRRDRIGDDFSTLPDSTFITGLTYSVNLCNEILKVNPLFAQPYYHTGTNKICFFLPYYSRVKNNLNEIDAVMVVADNRVVTIFSKSMAIKKAKALNIGIVDWLK